MKTIEDDWRLTTPLEIKRSSQVHPAYSQTVDWLENFLAQPHPNLGRAGAVCPFIPRALRENTIRLKVINTAKPNPKSIKKQISRLRDVFLNLEPKTGELSVYKAILIIFPDISHEKAPLLIDAIQKELKPKFVAEGLMLGEFHQFNQTSGLHNSEFFPLRSPVPMLAIRQMVESDVVFLCREIDVPQTRVNFLQKYIDRFKSILPVARLKFAESELTRAQLEISGGIR